MPPIQDSLEPQATPAKLSLKVSHTIAVLGIALSMRLLVLWTVMKHYPPQWLFLTRGIEIGLLAKSLLAGQGLSSPFGGVTGPTAFIAPIYPILIALVFKVFGEFSVSSVVAILLVQTLLNLVTIWLMMRVALRLFNQAAATFAGLLWGCSLPLIWMPTIFWETSLSCCLLVGLIALVLRYRDLREKHGAVWIKLGAYCGFAAMVNPALLPSLIFVSAWLVFETVFETVFEARRKATWKPLLSVLTFLVVFAPWPIRNAEVFHAFIPLRTTVGFELWMGNHAGATGFLDESLFPMFNQAELADYRARGEVAYSAHKSELARDYIAAHPADFLRMSAIRTTRFWSGTGTRNGSAWFAVHAMCTTLAGFAGLWLLVRSRRYAIAVLFALPLALFPLPYMITHAEFRYRLVIDPLLTILSAYAVTALYSLASRASHTKHEGTPVALAQAAARLTES